jgi:hypothetical protein
MLLSSFQNLNTHSTLNTLDKNENTFLNKKEANFKIKSLLKNIT